MCYTIPRYLRMLKPYSAGILFRPEFFELRHSSAIGKEVKCVGPVVRYPQGNVVLGFDVGTRGNRVDKPRWPKDLLTEIVVKEEVSTP
jgi:hypothetical protein